MKKIHDIIIIGGGIAGMTAGLYGHRSGRDILIIERAFFGGQIISTSEIENYPGFTSIAGHSFASELYSQIADMDIPHVSDDVSRIEADGDSWHIICSKGSYYCRSLIIATGTVSRKLGLPEEEKYIGHGLSYCATCDGAFHKNKAVAVVGGGSNALEEALYLSLLCKTVYLIHRSDRFTGEYELQRRVMETPNIEIMFNTTVTGLKGDSRLQAVETVSRPVCIEDSENASDCNSTSASEIEVTGLFVAIGQIPQNESFASAVRLDPQGYIEAGEDCRTSASGIFAAGDCRTKELRQLVTAAADGAVAAGEAAKYLNL